MSDKIKNGDMPSSAIELSGYGQFSPEVYFGLTKREMFAMAAMQGMLSNSGLTGDAESLILSSVKFADALLEGLEK